ncbi:hypothetical protein VE01_02523 [Pseudogymnoascus verrucosus]|uniref:Methyltransferase domain-containing protein n=1 Tax=Pseudogymnoascus verrucosus TaxID=342668 RepID=A0A1B8GU49_9PEZI|nr:uncharacterized protein VE01_02523 [Pseudogymnoascus verrucosus]OBT99362.1 hypothetical protein VE01_02523 [Pseudogymnoascus verrucosus]
MASLIPNILPKDSHTQIIAAGASIAILVGIVFVTTFGGKKTPKNDEELSTWSSFIRFFYACFLKPHEKSGENGQQDALESFYKAQAGVYDATRKRLLCGREDMLGLVAAQLKQKATTANQSKNQRRIWVDVGGGTGYNIEAMSKYLNVPEFFSSVYLVDFSPSLCEVARKRFVRLGWNNVKVVCQDARLFRLEDHEGESDESSSDLILPPPAIDEYFSDSKSAVGADLVTMSYSLSMIPDFYSVIDSLTNLLAPSGVIGVVDFYVQSVVDLSSRNYTGGALTRHVNWVSRLFWRAWFDIDRVGLDASRRDYLEYRFGTVLSADSRNYLLGAIPYYMWLGCPKKHSTALSPSSHDIIERIDAAVTESPYLHPANYTANLSKAVEKANPEIRSKAYSAALLNLTSNLPLPSFFYQNHHYRIHFDDQLQKHTQFNNEYIYAFTWEDTRVDDRILNLTPSDVVLAITSAGDNILSYALRSPARIHAVDLNPSQNNLLELKVAGYHCLPYADFWKIFGEGKHANFRELLIEKLSPHLSSRAFQYWLDNVSVFSPKGRGLYETGGSRYAVKLFRYMSNVFGLSNEVRKVLSAKTLIEQREIYRSSIRPVILSRILSSVLISQPRFLWAALGVPKNQLAVIESDYPCISQGTESSDGKILDKKVREQNRGKAVWQYMVDTLDPVVEHTLIGQDNHYYQVCMAGTYTPQCHPEYLDERAHKKLSRKDAFEGLRIHTDEIEEVVNRIRPGTLTVAVVMDSMDWFDPGSQAAATQIAKLNNALKLGGRVMLRSAGKKPWYIDEFEKWGFVAKREGVRENGGCIDRVNMYASCWILTKTKGVPVEVVTRDTASPEALEI